MSDNTSDYSGSYAGVTPSSIPNTLSASVVTPTSRYDSSGRRLTTADTTVSERYAGETSRQYTQRLALEQKASRQLGGSFGGTTALPTTISRLGALSPSRTYTYQPEKSQIEVTPITPATQPTQKPSQPSSYLPTNIPSSYGTNMFGTSQSYSLDTRKTTPTDTYTRYSPYLPSVIDTSSPNIQGTSTDYQLNGQEKTTLRQDLKNMFMTSQIRKDVIEKREQILLESPSFSIAFLKPKTSATIEAISSKVVPSFLVGTGIGLVAGAGTIVAPTLTKNIVTGVGVASVPSVASSFFQDPLTTTVKGVSFAGGFGAGYGTKFITKQPEVKDVYTAVLGVERIRTPKQTSYYDIRAMSEVTVETPRFLRKPEVTKLSVGSTAKFGTTPLQEVRLGFEPVSSYKQVELVGADFSNIRKIGDLPSRSLSVYGEKLPSEMDFLPNKISQKFPEGKFSLYSGEIISQIKGQPNLFRSTVEGVTTAPKSLKVTKGQIINDVGIRYKQDIKLPEGTSFSKGYIDFGAGSGSSFKDISLKTGQYKNIATYFSRGRLTSQPKVSYTSESVILSIKGGVKSTKDFGIGKRQEFKSPKLKSLEFETKSISENVAKAVSESLGKPKISVAPRLKSTSLKSSMFKLSKPQQINIGQTTTSASKIITEPLRVVTPTTTKLKRDQRIFTPTTTQIKLPSTQKTTITAPSYKTIFGTTSKVKIAPKITTIDIQIPTEITKTAQIQKPKQITRLRTPQITPRITPQITPATPKIPIIPPFANLGFGTSRRSGKVRSTNIFGYIPDYTSLIFKRRGKAFKGLSTGFETRPIPKGFSFGKLKIRKVKKTKRRKR